MEFLSTNIRVQLEIESVWKIFGLKTRMKGGKEEKSWRGKDKNVLIAHKCKFTPNKKMLCQNILFTSKIIERFLCSL